MRILIIDDEPLAQTFEEEGEAIDSEDKDYDPERTEMRWCEECEELALHPAHLGGRCHQCYDESNGH